MRMSLLILCAVLPLSAAERTHWVATWAASPAPQLADAAQMRSAKLEFDNQTLRLIARASLSGSSVRVRLSNAYNKQSVEIGNVHMALRSKESSIAPGSDRTLTFSGRPTVVIPPDAVVFSDPVNLNVPANSDIAVSIFLPKPTSGGGIHYGAQQTSYIGKGDQSASPAIDGPQTIASWVFLNGIDVGAPNSAGTIVAFGDSITDGARSTADANLRWPNVLATRLLDARRKLAVVDAGIGGNRILHDPSGNVRFGVNALARFDRDVLSQPGVKYVILLEGINDLGHAGSSAPESETVSAEDLIAAMKQLIARAHSQGVKIFAGTILPFEGTTFKGYFSPEKEVKRKAVNEWIRTTKAFDGFVDFEKAVLDPQSPSRIKAEFDSGDHLHPGDAGYKAMGQAVDLRLFR